MSENNNDFRKAGLANLTSSKTMDPVKPEFKAQVIKVTENVYVAVGFALANIIMIEGTDGIILVDSTENEKCALTILKEFRKITDKPIKGIILTHFHGDHINGTPALLEAEKNGGRDIKIYAHSTLVRERDDNMVAFDCSHIGASRQFGVYLKKMASALKTRKFLPRVVNPTHTFDKELQVNLAGVNLTLFHTPGETRDQISIWIPDWKVVMPADNISRAFPNLAAIRGSPPRDPEAWYRSLDKVRRLRARYMVPSHLEPVSGEKDIYELITCFRDAIQFVNDQTVRLLNDGYEVEEIVQKVRLPPSLKSHPYLQEVYGTVAWSVRGIIAGHLGWFDRNPVNLYPLCKQEKAERLNDLLSRKFEGSHSGIEKMLVVAEEGLKSSLQSDFQWSLELLSYALKTAEPGSPAHERAMQAAISCLKLLAKATSCPNGKRYYLSCAAELPTNFIKRSTIKGRAFKIQKWPIESTMYRMKFSFRAEACSDREAMTVIFSFPDVGQVHSYMMRHCMLEYITDLKLIPDEFDVKVTANSDVWKDLLTNKQSLISAQENNDIKITGKIALLERFMDLLNMCPETQPDQQPKFKSVL